MIRLKTVQRTSKLLPPSQVPHEPRPACRAPSARVSPESRDQTRLLATMWHWQSRACCRRCVPSAKPPSEGPCGLNLGVQMPHQTMQQFMWQPSMLQVAKFLDAGMERLQTVDPNEGSNI